MSLPKFPKHFVVEEEPTNYDFEVFQSNVEESVNPLLDAYNEIRTFEDESIGNGVVTTIGHNFGRSINGWRIIRANAAGIVYEDSDPDNDSLYLTATVSGVYSVEVW